MAARILSDLGCPDKSELSVAIVGDRSMRRINREYLGKDRSTNVISFAFSEGEFADLNPEALGDVVISADTAFAEANEGGIPHFERICFLLMHGILHICGYDHERSGEIEAARMEMKEQELFTILKNEQLLNPGVL